MANSVLIRQLLDAGVHFGHQTKRWNPKMERYIFGRRSGIYIIDLEKTVSLLDTARSFIEELGAQNKQVLYVGTKKQARAVVAEQAARASMPYVADKWLGGTMTNFNTIKQNITRYLKLVEQKATGEFDKMTKKDARMAERQLAKLKISVGNISTLDGPPAAMYIIDPKRESNAVHEANRLSIPIIAICDTNADPDLIAYPVPGNDDAIRSIRLITTMLTESLIAGRRRAGLPVPGDAPALQPPAPAELAAA